jgi:glycerol-3-phosphate dehydrogenase
VQGFWRLKLEDVRSGKDFHVVSKALVNASGPWVVDVTGRLAGVTIGRKLRMVRGSHLVVPRQWQGEHGYFLQTRDGRLMEAFPYEADFTSIGTTDEPWDDAPEKVAISDKEIDYMLAEVNAFLRKPVTRDEIVWSYAGVRPLFEVGGGRDGDLSALTRDYSFEIDGKDGVPPVLTVFGGKLTTHRRLAEHAMRELSRIMPWPKEGATRSEILPGGDFGTDRMMAYRRNLGARHPYLPEAQLARYVKLYGTRSDILLQDVRSLADLGICFGADLYEREVEFLRDTEWAETADDIVWRRTKLGLRMTRDEIAALDVYLRAGRG